MQIYPNDDIRTRRVRTLIFDKRKNTPLNVETGKADVKIAGNEWSRGHLCRFLFAVNVMLISLLCYDSYTIASIFNVIE